MSSLLLTGARLFALMVATQCFALVSHVALTNGFESRFQHNGPPSRGSAGCGMLLKTDTEGIDFNLYMRDTYLSVKKRWFANMPPSLEKGQQGTNAVEFHVLKDGSVPKDSIKMVVSSEKSDFDAASLQAVQEAAPFNHLPEKFSKPFIVLRFTFYYNVPIPRNP
jgi:TonB family protein